ncbi:MAG: flagellar basal-body rod protein FlgF [Firmicutes bacterium]|nr:flagellar basal-body rod protein FlgF [Bacillota bacterium]
MLRGMYTGASAMMAEQVRVDVLANNLANGQTTGFKREAVLQSAFPSMLLRRIGDPVRMRSGDAAGGDLRPVVGRLGTGTYVDGTYTVYEAGPLRFTGNSFDVALVGNGFFAVETPGGVRFTRDGRFTLDGDGWLVTLTGYRVLGQAGPIRILGSDVRIDEDGRVFVDGELVAALQPVGFDEPQGLLREGAGLWAATAASGPPQPAGARVHQGYLEQSNVNLVSTMVELISAYRSYEANQRVVQAYDQTLGKAVNELGRV